VPYIKEHQKERLARNTPPMDAGELTYVIYKTTLDFLRRGTAGGTLEGVREKKLGEIGVTYAEFAQALGCIESAKLELYRSQVAPYEDDKIEQNGDVL
jgi:hypothetical protein